MGELEVEVVMEVVMEVVEGSGMDLVQVGEKVAFAVGERMG